MPVETMGSAAVFGKIKAVVGLIVTAFKTWKQVGKWLGVRRAGRIARLAEIVDIPELHYVPNIRKQITSFLGDDDVYGSVEQAAKQPKPNLSSLEVSFRRHLFLPETVEERRLVVSREVVSTLVVELRKQMLGADGGLVLADELAAQRSAPIEAHLSSIEDIVSGRKVVPPPDLVKRVEELAKEKSHREVLAIWQATLKHIEASMVPAEVRASVIARTGLAAQA
ncbi:hypothetical protein ACN28S_20835 [Cystobacter fuscus]